MATQIVPAPVCAGDQGKTLADRLAHEASSYVRVTPTVRALVDRYGELTTLVDRLASRDSHYMSPSDRRELADAQVERYTLHQRIAAAGQLHLIEVAP